MDSRAIALGQAGYSPHALVTHFRTKKEADFCESASWFKLSYEFY
jgi:hypothetical protein